MPSRSQTGIACGLEVAVEQVVLVLHADDRCPIFLAAPRRVGLLDLSGWFMFEIPIDSTLPSFVTSSLIAPSVSANASTPSGSWYWQASTAVWSSPLERCFAVPA